jgi:transaldolase
MLKHLPADQNQAPVALSEQIKLYGDGASLEDFQRLFKEGLVTGFTTNPTLMHREKITDYEGFAKQLVALFPASPLSFEVFSDEFEDMKRQARKIAAWGDNVYVKIPITNTRGESSLPMCEELSAEGVKLNITAILTLEQAEAAILALDPDTPAIISVFAGRIADTGVDPKPIMAETVRLAAFKPKSEVLWASVREVYNLYEARDCGCHIITCTPDVLKKLAMEGMDLDELSLDTVKMFYKDAVSAGFTL